MDLYISNEVFRHFLIIQFLHLGIRILVTLLLEALPLLGNVFALAFLVLFIFSIIGVQLWQGVLRNRCFVNSTLLDNTTFM